jgi:hypothetical protein
VVHRIVTVHCSVRLLAHALTSARAVRTVHCYCTLLQSTVGVVAVTPHGTPDSPVLHRPVRCYTGQSGATPASPMNYSGVAPQNPEASKLELIHPGAPDNSVRQTRASFGFFCSFLFEPSLGLFIGLC